VGRPARLPCAASREESGVSGFAAVVCLLAGGDSQAGEDKPLTPAEQFQAIVKAQKQGSEEFSKAYNAAKTDEERAKVNKELSAKNIPCSYAPKVMALMRDHPKDDFVLDAFRWLTRQYCGGTEYEEAVDLVIRDWIEDKRMVDVFQTLGNYHRTEADRLLLAAIDKSPHRTVQGLARYTLAASIIQAANWQVNASPEERQAREKKAENLLEQVVEKYGDLEYGTSTLGKSAEATLFEVRHLGVGKTAPEIEGEDVDGKTMKLSDTRGKVVLVVFWGTWCGFCMADVPQHQALLKRYENKPFGIVGIDGNEQKDRAAVQKVCAEKGMNWRSFWDGDQKPPVAEKWNVHSWPMLYLLDSKGVIRYKGEALRYFSYKQNKKGKWEDVSSLDVAVDALMKEIAAEKP
jgi:thiol-disulfide isomerase/thioredoxin/outer membrane murein-binding lipoprotein Lpp